MMRTALLTAIASALVPTSQIPHHRRHRHHFPARLPTAVHVKAEPLVPWRPPGEPYDVMIGLYTRLYRDRIILLGKFLDEEASNQLVATLLYLQREDPNKPIMMYINIPGALMKATLAVYDTIQMLDCEVTTVNMGLATGMGAFLCAAGTKGAVIAFFGGPVVSSCLSTPHPAVNGSHSPTRAF